MKLTAHKFLMTLCAGLASAGCAASEEKVSSAPTAEHPRVVELYVASMIQARTHFIANGTFVAREELAPQASYNGRYDDLPVAQQRVEPTPARWAAFWRVVNHLDLAAWRPEYDQGDLPANRNGEHIILTDGLQWTMRLSTPGHQQTSEGAGAFPAVGRPMRTTTDYRPGSRNAVTALESAFDELIKP